MGYTDKAHHDPPAPAAKPAEDHPTRSGNAGSPETHHPASITSPSHPDNAKMQEGNRPSPAHAGNAPPTPPPPHKPSESNPRPDDAQSRYKGDNPGRQAQDFKGDLIPRMVNNMESAETRRNDEVKKGGGRMVFPVGPHGYTDASPPTERA